MKSKSKSKQFYKHKISNLLNIQKIVTIHYQEPEKDYVSVEESHDFWEINYADKNDFYVCFGNEKHLLKQGEMIFIKPNYPHNIECTGKEPNIFIISAAWASAAAKSPELRARGIKPARQPDSATLRSWIAWLPVTHYLESKKHWHDGNSKDLGILLSYMSPICSFATPAFNPGI